MIRYIKLFIYILILFSINLNVYAFETAERIVFCESYEVLKIFRIAGVLILVMKILVPLIIIIIGSIDFGKAMLSGDDKDMTISAKRLIYRFISGVVIFFIPTIVNAVFNLIPDYSNFKTKTVGCEACLLKPNDASCQNAITSSRRVS